MYVGRKLGRRPQDAELCTLEERDGSMASSLGNKVVSISATDPFALARAGVWQTAWHSLG